MIALPPDFVEALRDRYTLERELGRGGMAIVYLARDLKHDRPVALKVLHAELAATLGPERFLREVRTTARLQHPHILPVLDSGTAAGQLWYTMPYVRGESLRDRLRREVQLPVEVAVDLARQVALALDYAHREGVIHRDLKPENILLSEGQALVADFGVAKALAAGSESQLTETGMALGTPAYMSPEQASADQVDGRSDIYALGCVLYEMLAGEPPFTGPTPQAVLAKRVLEPVPHVRTLRESVPETLEQAITRALAKAPADRFPSAGEFARALTGATPLNTVNVAPALPTQPTSTGDRQRQPVPRHTIALGLAALLVLGASAAALLWRSRTAPTRLDADLLAVAPFDVLDPRLQLWREGLVDLLSRNLDGAGPLRTVSPTVIVRRWRGRADRTTAEALARATGAGLALYGTLVGSGRDSVRLTASVLDVSQSEVVGEAELRGTADRMDQLADSLTVRVLRELGATRPIGAARSGGLGSRSLAALRAFLRGEQFFRRTEWDSARVSYERAIGLDTAFALAYWRLGTIRGWQFSALDSLGHAYSQRAAALNRGLPPRESLLLACDSLMSALPAAGALPDSAGRETLRRLFSVAERVTAQYPTDPEAWVALGEARFHFGFGLGVSDAMKLEAFGRAIQLDSAYAPAYIHPIDLALTLNDQPAARRYAARYLALRPGGQTALAASVTKLLLDPSTPAAKMERVLDTMPSGALVHTWISFFGAPDSAEVAIGLARRLAARHITGEGWWRYPDVRQHMVATSLAFRGHLREAARMVSAQPELADWHIFAELAMAGAIPPDTVDAFYRQRMEKVPFWSSPRYPEEEGFLMAPVWWASRGDTVALKRYVERLSSRGRSSAPSRAPASDIPRNPYWIAAGEAYLTLARRDSAGALTRFAALPDSTGPVWFERLTLARLLAARGGEREALAVMDREFPFADPVAISQGVWALERARLAEQLGQFEKARYWYGYIVALWRLADAEVQPSVNEAREALGRLTTEIGR